MNNVPNARKIYLPYSYISIKMLFNTLMGGWGWVFNESLLSGGIFMTYNYNEAE